MQNYDVVIVGGGAAGLACAVTLKKEDAALSVAICERGDRLGKKLAATGNGQGNISNTDLSPEHYHGSLAALASQLINSGEYKAQSLFDCLFVSDKSGRIYPAGKQASSLSDCLIRKAEKYGVEVLLNAEVTSVSKGFHLTLADGRKLHAKHVVFAFGGKAQKQFGTDGKAYSLAHSMGHSTTELTPAIVQLKCETQYIKTLKGIRAECKVRAFDKDGEELCKTSGDVIFTDYGVSGNAIFNVSSYVAGKEGAYLSIEFIPVFSQSEVENHVRKKRALGYSQTELLSGTLHNQIGRAIIRRCNSSDPAVIAQTVKNFKLPVVGTLGFDYAQVTKGGIPTNEVDGDLQSRKHKGLYFVGEALDVDGDCGGYNLTWAFVSGMHVAKKIIETINNYD